MKLTKQLAELKKKQTGTRAGAAGSSAPASVPFDFRRWAVLGLLLLLAGVATWAVFEFFIWSTIPAELVGKWVVQGGPQDGAVFDFYRNGTLEAHLNNQGREDIMKARVAVEDKTLLTTTTNPKTKEDETRRSIIRELTRKSLVLEFEKGEVWRMVRAE